MACDSVVVVQPAAGGVAIERRFNLAVAVIGAIQIQNVSACTCGRTARLCCVCCVSRIMLLRQLLRLRI